MKINISFIITISINPSHQQISSASTAGFPTKCISCTIHQYLGAIVGGNWYKCMTSYHDCQMHCYVRRCILSGTQAIMSIRPDIMLFDRKNQARLLTDMGVAYDKNVMLVETELIGKHTVLEN